MHTLSTRLNTKSIALEYLQEFIYYAYDFYNTLQAWHARRKKSVLDGPSPIHLFICLLCSKAEDHEKK